MYKHECLVIAELGPKKTWLDLSHKCMPFTTWANQSGLALDFLQTAHYVFTKITEQGPIIPYVEIIDGTIVLTWNNDSITQPRILYVALKPNVSFRYQLTVRPVIGGDHDWKYVTDFDKVNESLIFLGQYLEGSTIGSA